jgi:SAM-dependent methyltransferase
MKLQDDSVFRFRAVRSGRLSLEEDPEPMIQQQLARLKFFENSVGSAGCTVLDWGCGTGYNCSWLISVGRAKEAVGFDLSEGSIAIAKATEPGIEFIVADACDPMLGIRPGYWDRIISCEVLEHVPDMRAFLKNLHRHLSQDGVAFVSTPNRLVFSLGHEPSPVNKEHIKELTPDEFISLLKQYFSSVTIYGQQFRDDSLLDSWKNDVRKKIAELEKGTRWIEKSPTRLKDIGLLNRLYRIGPVRAGWKLFRWQVLPAIRDFFHPTKAPYMHYDFDFVTGDLDKSLWICAVLHP